MKTPCATGGSEVAVSVYSGKNKDDEPRICVNGRFVIARNLNKAGRGLNIVVMNATIREVLRVGHFDTYEQDSSTLEIFLEDTINGETVVIVSFDEASTRLSNMAKQMFYELGSGLVQNLKFRSSWYFIGQKGIKGFTPFEELNYAQGSDWAKPIDKKMCLPATLDGTKVRPDPTVQPQNEAKRHFCKKYDGYEDFCDEVHIDDAITPAPLHNKSMEGHQIFNIPILIIAGLSHNSLRLCLETLLRQPGIQQKNVLVTFDENYPESEALAHLFGVESTSVSSSRRQSAQFAKSLEKVWGKYPNAGHVIVLEEELLVTADFLYFMAQMLSVLLLDPTLLAASAWNDNGFKLTSGLSDTVYRVEGFPGLGFLLPKRTYTSFMKGEMEQCCNKRAWEGWLLKGPRSEQHVLVPDLSRVYRRHAEGLGMIPPHIEDLLRPTRSYNTDPDAWILNASETRASAYDALLTRLIKDPTAVPLRPAMFKTCLLTSHGRSANFNAAPGRIEEEPLLELPGHADVAKRHVYLVYFEQSGSSDEATLYQLCRCFGLYHSRGRPARGLYKGLLRFTYSGHPVLLIGSASPFFSLKPSNLRPIGSSSSSRGTLPVRPSSLSRSELQSIGNLPTGSTSLSSTKARKK
jgi:beta-1,2-N-acetylglucosaminyltransferase